MELELNYLLIGILFFWIGTIESTLKFGKDIQKTLLYTNITNERLLHINQLKYVYIYNYIIYYQDEII